MLKHQFNLATDVRNRRGTRLIPVLVLVGLAHTVALAQTEPAASVRIKLQNQVQLTKKQVLLGDIASLSSQDPSLLYRVMTVPLGVAPVADQPVTLEKEQLARWIRRQTGLVDRQMEWEGSASTLVGIRNRLLSGEEIAREAQAGLRKLLQSTQPANARIEIEAIRLPSDVMVMDDHIELRIRAPESLLVAPKMTVWVDVFSADSFLRAIPVGFEVGVFSPVAVTTRAVDAGMPLAPHMVALQEKNIAGLASPVRFLPDAQEQPVRSRRGLRSGEVLQARQTEAVPDVDRGNSVVLESRQAGISLQGRADVLQDGKIGQWIRIRPEGSRAVVMAKVIARGKVELAP